MLQIDIGLVTSARNNILMPMLIDTIACFFLYPVSREIIQKMNFQIIDQILNSRYDLSVVFPGRRYLIYYCIIQIRS